MKSSTVLTVLGRNIDPVHLQELEEILSELGADQLARTWKTKPGAQRACLELSLLGEPEAINKLGLRLPTLAETWQLDLVLQSDDESRTDRQLVVFDMDSTLIQCEVIDELARLHGVYDQVSTITERAMQGELDFRSSFTHRLGLLEGLPLKDVEGFLDRLPLMDGAERLTRNLKRLGIPLAICSGGFTPMAVRLQKILGIDYAFANHLEHSDGSLTGRVVGEIVDAEAKARFVRELAHRMNIELRHVVAIGDGANDLPMLELAGLGIAFRAKPIVRAHAQHSVSNFGLDAVLYLMGFSDDDIV